MIALTLSAWDLIRRYGGVGLLLLGLIPLPGSQDLFTILLAAFHRRWWLYYALLSTIGSVIGGYLTYKIGRKGGSEALERRVSGKKLKRIDRAFEKYGFVTIILSTTLPPPFPTAAVLAAAGALNYPVKKYIAALGLGRCLRFTAAAYIGSAYGGRAYQFTPQHEREFLLACVALAVLAGGALAFYFLLYRHKSKPATAT